MVTNKDCVHYDICFKRDSVAVDTLIFLHQFHGESYDDHHDECENCNKYVKNDSRLSMKIDIPKTMTDEEYLDSIDISNELRLMKTVELCGSYKDYKAIQKRTGELISEMMKKSEN